MKHTFINQNSENNVSEEGRKHCQSRLQDLNFFMNFQVEGEPEFLEAIKDFDFDGLEDLKTAIDNFENLGSFHEYGLSFDFVDAGTFTDQTQGYYRYQFSWGGPSEELRIYQDGTVEFVYLHWGCGVGFDVSSEDCIEWLIQYFEDCQLINWDSLSPEQIETYEEEE